MSAKVRMYERVCRSNADADADSNANPNLSAYPNLDPNPKKPSLI